MKRFDWTIERFADDETDVVAPPWEARPAWLCFKCWSGNDYEFTYACDGTVYAIRRRESR